MLSLICSAHRLGHCDHEDNRGRNRIFIIVITVCRHDFQAKGGWLPILVAADSRGKKLSMLVFGCGHKRLNIEFAVDIIECRNYLTLDYLTFHYRSF